MAKGKTEVEAVEATDGTEKVKQTRTRKPTEPKPVFVVFKAAEDGKDIELLDVTRSADKVLKALEAPGARYKQIMATV